MPKLYFPNFYKTIPNHLIKQINHIYTYLHSNYNADCKIVGGAIRDRLLGREIKDIDIECYNISTQNFHKAMNELNADGFGKSFFVYKLGDIDIALPRKETKIANGHRGFSVEPVDNEKDACKRRDFTINAMLYDIKSSTILDYFSGLEDISNKILRVVDQNTFYEDSLRVLRGMQFASRLHFKIEPNSIELSKSMDLSDLAKERIFIEFEKMFLSTHLHYGLYYLEELQISKKLWNTPLTTKNRFKAMTDMKRYQKYFLPHLYPYYFLAIYYQYTTQSMDNILSAINTPNHYKRVLKNISKIPHPLTNSFVASQALKDGIKNSPLNYHHKVIQTAKYLNIWDKPFDIGITPQQLISKGFKGAKIGQELSKIQQQRLKELDAHTPSQNIN